MSKQIRRSVFNELKHNVKNGITVHDLMIVTNSDEQDVVEALKYFQENGIVEKLKDEERWYVTY